MTSHLLDTDSIIDYVADIATSVAFIRSLRTGTDILCTCDVVLAEVYSGLHARDSARAQILLASLLFLPTSPEAARQAGAWRYAFARQGVALSTTDCLIAATAYEHQARLVTANLRDYPMAGPIVVPLPRVAR